MLRLAFLLLVLLIAGSTMVRTERIEGDAATDLAIRAEPVLLDAADPERDRVGALRYLGGWELTSRNPEFGGISAIARDGDGFLAIGDAGGVFRFGLGADGRIARAGIGALPDGPEPEDGGEVQKRDRDAESLAHDPESGRYWVGFENANAIWRYGPRLANAEAHRAPEAMAEWPFNGGPEALLRFADGRFLVFSEEGGGPDGSLEAFLFASDPSELSDEPLRLGYRPPEGYRITDATPLPDGRLLILNRRFTITEGVSVILAIADIEGLADGGIIESRAIARFDPPLTIDNMEALAVAQENGRTIVWMASDDNFNPLQRTLLLKFELVEN